MRVARLKISEIFGRMVLASGEFYYLFYLSLIRWAAPRGERISRTEPRIEIFRNF